MLLLMGRERQRDSLVKGGRSESLLRALIAGRDARFLIRSGSALCARKSARHDAIGEHAAMLIRQILADKGSKVVATRPDATVLEVARLLKEKRIGAVVVTERQGRLCGIISERDLARGLAEHGAGLLETKVEQLMTKDVVTCSPEDGVQQLMHKMTAGRFRHLPVIEDGELVGIISIGDVVKHRLEELEAETHLLHDYIAGA
jgi:CBS domain-containing protein